MQAARQLRPPLCGSRCHPAKRECETSENCTSGRGGMGDSGESAEDFHRGLSGNFRLRAYVYPVTAETGPNRGDGDMSMRTLVAGPIMLVLLLAGARQSYSAQLGASEELGLP